MVKVLPFNPPEVTSLAATDDYILRLTADGVRFTIDFKQLTIFGRHPQLQDLNYFNAAKLRGGCIEWPNNLHMDLDEIILELAIPEAPGADKLDHSCESGHAWKAWMIPGELNKTWLYLSEAGRFCPVCEEPQSPEEAIGSGNLNT